MRTVIILAMMLLVGARSLNKREANELIFQLEGE